MRQRRRNFGRLHKMRSGRWQAGYVGPDGAVHYAESTFDAKDDAIAWLTRERRMLEDGTVGWLPPKERAAAARAALPETLREYSARWLSQRDLKPTTHELYRGHLNRRILPELGSLRLDQIQPTTVSRWWGSLGSKHPTARHHAYSLLRVILASAVDEHLIPSNPCTVRNAGNSKTKHKAEAATLDELAVIVEHMPERLRLAVLIAAWCGLRQGEIVELRRRDVELAAGLIHVRRAVTRVAGSGPIVGTPKSEAGVRTVAIPPHLIPEFRQHMSAHVKFGRDALLFAGRDSGEQLAPTTLLRHYYPAREAAGRPDLRWHDLRHTSATMAAQTGATLAELMNRLGHSTVAAAMRYQHSVSDRDRAIAEALSRLAEVKGAGA